MRKRGMARGGSAACCSLGWLSAGARGNGLRTGLAGRAGVGLGAAGQHGRQPHWQSHSVNPIGSRTALFELASSAKIGQRASRRRAA